MIAEYNVKLYCCEDISLIENYEMAIKDNKIWDCHHKLELIETGAVVNSSKQDLIDWGLYYNRPADELVFIRHGEHTILHSPRKGTGNYLPKPKVYADPKETSRKCSEVLKGRPGAIGIKSTLSHPVIVVETGDVFGSKREAMRKYGRHSFDIERAKSSRTRRTYYTLKCISRDEYWRHLYDDIRKDNE